MSHSISFSYISDSDEYFIECVCGWFQYEDTVRDANIISDIHIHPFGA